MRVIIWSDAHLHNHRIGDRLEEGGISSRLSDGIAAMNFTMEAVHKHNAAFRLFAGDLFHVRGKIAPSVLNPVLDAFVDAHKRVDFVDFMIPGNHDQEARVDGAHAVHALNIVPGVRVADGYGFEILRNAVGDELGVGWVCHHPDIPVMLARIGEVALLADATTASYKVLLIHHGIDGTLPEIPDCGLGVADLPVSSFGWIFAGDYHLHKQLAPNIWSVGCPYQMTFGDVGKSCGYLVLDTDTGQVEHHWLDLPQFITHEENQSEGRGSITCYGREPKAGDFVRVRCDRQERLDELMKGYKERGAAFVQGELTATAGATTQRVDDALKLVTDPRAMFETWLVNAKVEADEIDELRALNNEILGEVA